MTRRVDIRQAGRTIDVPAGRTILERALEEGIAYPHGCRSGRCGSCKSRLLSGEVDLFDVPIYIPLKHPPIIEIVPWHRRMLGKSDLRQANTNCLGSVLRWLPFRVATEGGMHVIVRWYPHGQKLGKNSRLAKR